MEKKLPRVFANPLNKEISTNKKVSYSAKEEDHSSESKESRKVPIMGTSIRQKIKAIFDSPLYVYKADVEITTKNGKVVKKIVGRNNTHLITLNNEKIAIDEIDDIQFVKEK